MCIEDQNLSESEMFLPSFRRIKLNNSVQWCYIWFSGWFLVRILSIAWSTEVVPQHHIHILAHLKTNKQTNTKAKQKQTTKNTGSIKFTIDSKSKSDWNEPLGDHSVSPTAQSESDWIMLLRALSRWILNISKDSLDLSAGLPPVWSCLSSMRVPNTRHCSSLINIVKKSRELSYFTIKGQWPTCCPPGPPESFLQSCFPACCPSACAGAWSYPALGAGHKLGFVQLLDFPFRPGPSEKVPFLALYCPLPWFGVIHPHSIEENQRSASQLSELA